MKKISIKRTWLGAAAVLTLLIMGVVAVPIGLAQRVHAVNYANFSGVLTDGDGTPIGGATVVLSGGSLPTATTAVTDASGYYTMTRQVGIYYLTVYGNMSGLGSYSFSQTGGVPGVNLNYGDVVRNLRIPTTTLSVTPRNNVGAVKGSGSVIARTTGGKTSLYPGDTGMSINIIGSANATWAQPTVSIKSVVGAIYGSNGLETANTSGSICSQIQSSSSLWDCLTESFRVTGVASIDVPSAMFANRIFQGIVRDGQGAPLPNTEVYLVKYGDLSVRAVTDSNGYFITPAAPKAYSLKLVGYVGNYTNSFSLSQPATTPSVNLSSSNIPLDLSIPSVDITVNAHDTNGDPLYFATVSAEARSGVAYLYTGDPGFNIASFKSGGFSTNPSASGTIKSIVGATYAAAGLGVTSSAVATSICTFYASVTNCLTTPFVVNGPGTVNTPF